MQGLQDKHIGASSSRKIVSSALIDRADSHSRYHVDYSHVSCAADISTWFFFVIGGMVLRMLFVLELTCGRV